MEPAVFVCFFERVLGCGIVLILDGSHLENRGGELMSRIASTTTEKERHCRVLLGWLWEGNVDDALPSLRPSVSVRHQKPHQELITSLTQHTAEIIKYQARQETGKPIGRGRPVLCRRSMIRAVMCF
ncbi:hypothetical protein U27_03327 [Candidatus Vecturithrix granuli]|uniref:Uncharacterized protein n=1 Tax=Vecturithrix granuli TaxID=1499967 RepID=A0A081BVL0_VECG1|nr:hypothetical protein U27_03327 [Candidatus Vecturithrix granuli]